MSWVPTWQLWGSVVLQKTAFKKRKEEEDRIFSFQCEKYGKARPPMEEMCCHFSF
jgi:hypothetical protein